MNIVTDINSKKQKENEALRKELTHYQKRVKRQKWANKALLFLLAVIILAGAWFYAYKKTESWILKQMVVSVTPLNHVVKTAKAAEMTVEEYAHFKFGKQANTVLAIMKAESGGNPYAINKNNDKGGTFDLGCMQLNEKWQLKPRGLTREDAFDCKKSLDVTYQIYQEQGNFCAWVTYQRMDPKACKKA